MQVTEENPMVGLEGRASLLSKLGEALTAHSDYFGKDGRPGNIVGRCSLGLDNCGVLKSCLQTSCRVR
jgi:hypothetical protein